MTKLNVLHCIPSSKWCSSVCREQLLYVFFYFKMKQSMQSNQCKKACNFWAKLCEKAFLSNLIPIYLFTSLTCKQKL